MRLAKNLKFKISYYQCFFFYTISFNYEILIEEINRNNLNGKIFYFNYVASEIKGSHTIFNFK